MVSSQNGSKQFSDRQRNLPDFRPRKRCGLVTLEQKEPVPE